jgi:2',3'-cyclic-nucleotide 2'-phosphodiesterase (5'-nucleotidase family)
MRKTLKLIAGTAVMTTIGACSSHYELTSISHQRIVIDKRFDAQPDKAAADFMIPYKQKVDSIMGPVVGRAAHYMNANRPESDLLIWASKDYDEKPDMSIYNIGGIRTGLAKGDVTYGDVLDIAPFENKICFLTLTGDKLLKLLRQIAARGGEGVSHGTELVISAKGELLSVRLHGKEIDPNKSYRIATIDYLIQGNDGMTAFREGTQVVSPKESKNNTRFIIINYFKEKAAKGEAVSAKVEGRIKVKNEE